MYQMDSIIIIMFIQKTIVLHFLYLNVNSYFKKRFFFHIIISFYCTFQFTELTIKSYYI